MTPRKSRKFWRRIAITVLALFVLLAMFVVSFVFNPLEGSLRDVRDVVPREVDFFVRKTDLAADFDGGLRLNRDSLPRPWFWDGLVQAPGWPEVERGPWFSSLKQQEPALRQARDALLQVQEGSRGLLDLSRDLVGREVTVAGYYQDPTKNPPQPLQQPWWCVYARIGWRLRAAWGLLQWSMVQDMVKSGGVQIGGEGQLLVVRAQGMAEPLYAARHLDCLMLANSRHLLEQSLRLASGEEGEQPFGQSSRYSAGVLEPVARWTDVRSLDRANAVEFSIAPNATDSFRRVSSTWPDPRNKDSMNERVLASFLNLSGWISVTGALLFEPEELAVLGEVVLNSNKHNQFQSAFYRAESQARKEWLDPFLRMVPDSACAAAALRTPVGDFLHAMFEALLPDDKQLLDDILRRCTMAGQQLTDTRDLIDRLKLAFLPRTGFVFRRNRPDTFRDKTTGEMKTIPVAARSPVPQIAWLFWIRDGSQPIVESFARMMKEQAGQFRFTESYTLTVDGLPEPVSEFLHPQIPGTGEIAMIVFRQFFVISNSGPLIKDMLRTRYNFKGARSMVESDAYQRIESELSQSVNGFVWLRGPNLLPVLEDYRKAVETQNQDPDPDWMVTNLPGFEEVVRRARYPQYPTKASMPQSLRDGEFREAVQAYLREQWQRAAAGYSAEDLAGLLQLYGLARIVDAAYLQVDLDNNYIRFQGKAMARY